MTKARRAKIANEKVRTKNFAKIGAKAERKSRRKKGGRTTQLRYETYKGKDKTVKEKLLRKQMLAKE